MALKACIICVVLIVGFINIASPQKCPALPDVDESVEASAKVNGTYTQQRGYPEKQAKRLSKNKKYKTSVIDAEKTLKYCDTKSLVPLLPPPFQASNVCPSYNKPITIPWMVYLGGRWCWVLNPWAGKKCNRVVCSRKSCDVPFTAPIPYYRCRSTNYKSVKVYAICPKKPSGWELKYYYIPLAQCCSCIKYTCIIPPPPPLRASAHPAGRR